MQSFTGDLQENGLANVSCREDSGLIRLWHLQVSKTSLRLDSDYVRISFFIVGATYSGAGLDGLFHNKNSK